MKKKFRGEHSQYTSSLLRTIASATPSISVGQAVVSDGYYIKLANSSNLSGVLVHAGIATSAGSAGAEISIVHYGLVDPAVVNLGAGLACAVGTDASGNPVRVTDPACVSGRKYLGSCDVNGAIYVSPFNDDRYNVLNYGAVADSDGAGAGTDLGAVLNLLIGIVSSSRGGEIYVPGGLYRIATTVIVNRNVLIRGAGGGIFYAPTQLFVDESVTGFVVTYGGSQAAGSAFERFWIGAVANNATTTTGTWTQSSRQIAVSSIADFAVGQVVCLAGIGGQTSLPYVLGTVSMSSNSVTLSNVNGYGLKVGHYITLGAAFPTATRITAIDKSVPSAWVLTMATAAASAVTSGQVKYCFDCITRITAIAGTTVTVDDDASHCGSGSIPSSASNVVMSHADCAFYLGAQISASGVYIGGGSTSGTLGFAGAGWAVCGSTTDVPDTNCDMVYLSDSYVQHCKHAVYTRGDTANVVRVLGITAVQCNDWSFCEGAFLGNTYVACHADGGFGFVSTASAANASVFLGCYLEGGTYSALGAGALWLGGVQAYDPGGTAIVGGRTNRAYFSSNDNTMWMQIAIADFGNSTDALLSFGTPGSSTYNWTFERTTVAADGFAGWLGLRHSQGTRSFAMLITDTDASDYVSGAPRIWFPNGIFIGGPSAALSQKVGIFSGSGSPNGVVTAPVGSIYTDRSGGAGTVFYVKESGAGNTGWTTITQTPNVRTITADYTVDASGHDDTIICDTTSGPINLTLPANTSGRCLNVIDKTNNFATHNVTLIRPGGTGNINNASSDLALATNGMRTGIEGDGTDWYTST